ncbi:hypothetical protein JTE90_012782 [Oedothorax gibbosus]|uniref:Rab3 GTPase-activating protein catalytic subunit n=1 Tax=Oedothorax gibbosus TaxID=931172 RepID=A0AAV6W2Q9_9ARAC|nr:hypothetical protein JTE90_012782 [Oedothorax gibbosus]
MSSEEEQDVFEITDFTTASEWERFISRIEEVFHEWKLPQRNFFAPLKKGELSDGVWLEKREQLMFASFQFEAVHHFLKTEHDSSLAPNDEEENDPLPYYLGDLVSKENDFPPKAHCLVRWYGLREFVVIYPAKTNDAIMTEDRTKMLMSSISIAVNNTNCPVPVFVQLQQMRQRYFLGVCEGGGRGVRTSFDMVHLHRPLSQYSHLSGLLSLFKDKLGCTSSGLDGPPISVSIRFTYVLHDWSPCSWPQPPPDIEEIGEILTPSDIGRLPCGAVEDPVLEFHLSVTWPCLSEKAVIDNDVHSDLNPLLSPKWSMRMRTSEKPVCSMDNRHITNALDKLAAPTISSLLPPRPNRGFGRGEGELPIEEELLIKILQYIFPDSAPTPAETDTVNYLSEVNVAFSRIQEVVCSLKSAPPNSLTWRLALAMCHVHHGCGGLAAVAQLWQDFLLEMRHRWENNYTLPCLDPGAPNMNYCLLHQKLQMLNCCIQRKKSREWQQRSTSEESSVPQPSSESDEDEFYECTTSLASAEDARPTRRRPPEGRLRQLGNATLLHHPEEPLYIPITQDPAPVTEDALAEQADALVKLGEDAEGAALRARMQSACLSSDMEAFKAANPKSSLEDFVRWYSPRDLIEEQKKDEETGNEITKYALSARMLLPGNMWLESWESARAVPARRQRRLFDDTREAEKVLHFLASAKTSEVVTFLMPMLVHCAILQLAEEGEECPRSLPLKLEEATIKAAKVMRSYDPKYETVLRLLYEAEVIVAQMQSVSTKFGLLMTWPTPEGEMTKRVQRDDGEVSSFVLRLMDEYEVEVPGAGKGAVGKRIRQLFADAQKASQLLPEDIPQPDPHPPPSPSSQEFPLPSGREFILRSSSGRSIQVPQRLYAVVTSDEFRLCGAFTEDTTFL